MSNGLHFTHGNGFPARSYQQLFNGIKSCVARLSFTDRLGHSEHYPVTDNWHYLSLEVIQAIEANHNQPVIGMGHSFGGVVQLMASFQRPDLYKSIILLDSPRFGLLKSQAIKYMKRFGMMNKVTPAGRAKKRVTHWPNRQALETYLNSKELYARFDPRCLSDYISYGTEKDENGCYHLRYDRALEDLVYRTLPDNLHTLPSQPAVPTFLIYGRDSHIITRHDLRVMSRKYQIHCQPCEGGHMFPLEAPEEASRLVLDILKKFV